MVQYSQKKVKKLRALIKYVPNLLSFSRIFLTPVFIFLFLEKDPWLVFTGILVFSIGAITDYFDGYIARKYNTISQLGKFIDPFADKVLTFAGFIILSYLYPSLYSYFGVAVIIVRDVAVTLLRVYANKKNIEFTTSKSAKWKTAFQMIFLYLATLLHLNSLMPQKYNLFKIVPFIPVVLEICFIFVSVFTLLTGVQYFLAFNEGAKEQNPS